MNSFSQSLEDGHKSIEKGEYNEAITIFNNLIQKGKKENASLYVEAKLGLAKVYTDIGVMHLSNIILKQLKEFIISDDPKQRNKLAKINLMIADNYDLLFNLKEFLNHIDKFYTDYKSQDNYSEIYEATYHAYMSRYYNLSFDINQAYFHSTKALDFSHKYSQKENINNDALIIEPYKIYAAHCLTLRNYAKVNTNERQKYFDTLKHLVKNRFKHNNIKKAKSIINTSSIMLDLVFNYYNENQINKSLKNPDSLYRNLISNYTNGAFIYKNLLGNQSDYLPRYYNLQSWLAYGKRDIQSGLQLTEHALKSYSLSQFIDRGIVPNYARVMASLRFKSFLLNHKYESTKDSIYLKQNIANLEINEKLWVNFQKDQILGTKDFLTNDYNQNPYQYLYKSYLDLFKITKNEHYLRKVHEYDEKSKYNSLVFSLQRKLGKNEYSERQKVYLLMEELVLNRVLEKNDEILKQKIKNKINALSNERNSLVPDLKEIQNQFKDNEAQVSYSYISVGINKVYAKIMTKNSLKVIEIDSFTSFRKYKDKTDDLITSLKKNDVVSFKNISHELYSLLFEKVKKQLPGQINKIEIIPFAHIEALPFDLLINSNPKTEDFRKLPYLIKQFTFKYAFSNTIKKLSLRKKPKSQLDIYKPSFDSTLTDLDYGSSIAKKIKKYQNGNLYLNENAKLSNFTSSLSNSSHITLITHAKSNQKILNDGKGIYFDDKFLSLDSVYNFSSKTDLLILTACGTGAGYVNVGEGNMSLARAFTSIGVKSLIVSSWDIDEYSTTKILNDFYKHYKGEKTGAIALREAKLDYIKTSIPRTANPLYWAGLNVIGNESYNFTEGYDIELYLYILIGILFLILLFFLVKKDSIMSRASFW